MNEKQFQSGIKHLRQDPILKKVIDAHEPPKWAESGDLFVEIVENIIGQQLSAGPARTITNRFTALFNNEDRFPTAKQILETPDQSLRDVGLSWAKVSYIKNFSQWVDSGKLDLEKIKTLPDEEIVSELTQVKGIGRWTAEMALIFLLKRPDVFSLGDLGLCTAISKLYGVDRKDTKKIQKLSHKWSPYRSLACRYLWISLDSKTK